MNKLIGQQNLNLVDSLGTKTDDADRMLETIVKVKRNGGALNFSHFEFKVWECLNKNGYIEEVKDANGYLYKLTQRALDVYDHLIKTLEDKFDYL